MVQAGAKANRSGGGRGCLLCDSHHKYVCVHPILIVQSLCTISNSYNTISRAYVF